MKTITVVEFADISTLPPTQNLIRVLLFSGHRVHFIGNNLESLQSDISQNPNFNGLEYDFSRSYQNPKGVKDKLRAYRSIRELTDVCMEDSDVLWTTSMETSKALYKNVLKYKNVMQLMELQEFSYTLHGHVKIHMDDIARRSWKVVCAEVNRSYIQKIWWDLPQTPVTMPNKPFTLDYGELTNGMREALEKMRAEKRKIILYLGVLYKDREFISLARAIEKMKDWAFYLAGRYVSGEDAKAIEQYGAIYLGAFVPPKHLALLEEAYIGVLPYSPQKTIYSEFNALYCAPNKIWEYAGFGVPMVGSDVLGLKQPFEQWNIGKCCDLNDEQSIINAIKYVDEDHDEMSANCHKFYDSVDLNRIVSGILEEAHSVQTVPFTHRCVWGG